MQIRIADIPEEGLVLDMDTPASHFPVLKQMQEQGECRFLSDIRTHLEIQMVVDIIQVRGRLETTGRLPCSRCLSDYDAPLAHRFTVSYTREAGEAETDPSEMALTAADLGLIFFNGDMIELRDAIQEQVVLSLPLRPLCRETCKGLCHNCGSNLNEGDCGCGGKDAIDPRLAILKKLKISDK